MGLVPLQGVLLVVMAGPAGVSCRGVAGWFRDLRVCAAGCLLVGCGHGTCGCVLQAVCWLVVGTALVGVCCRAFASWLWARDLRVCAAGKARTNSSRRLAMSYVQLGQGVHAGYIYAAYSCNSALHIYSVRRLMILHSRSCRTVFKVCCAVTAAVRRLVTVRSHVCWHADSVLLLSGCV